MLQMSVFCLTVAVLLWLLVTAQGAGVGAAAVGCSPSPPGLGLLQGDRPSAREDRPLSGHPAPLAAPLPQVWATDASSSWEDTGP